MTLLPNTITKVASGLGKSTIIRCVSLFSFAKVDFYRLRSCICPCGRFGGAETASCSRRPVVYRTKKMYFSLLWNVIPVDLTAPTWIRIRRFQPVFCFRSFLISQLSSRLGFGTCRHWILTAPRCILMQWI